MVELVVTLRKDADLQRVAARLHKAGLTVHEKMAEIGMVTGTAKQEAVAKLRAIEGVEDVSESTPVQLPPPGSPVT